MNTHPFSSLYLSLLILYVPEGYTNRSEFVRFLVKFYKHHRRRKPPTYVFWVDVTRLAFLGAGGVNGIRVQERNAKNALRFSGGGPCWDRTSDLLLKREPLYQLS